ncbi:MAG: hypothetical protein GY870_01575 [archaeon]|nr:hypothetical protein [archaeon]
MQEITRFVIKEDPTKDEIFELMTQKIGLQTRVSAKLIRKCGENAFKDWQMENNKNRELSTIFTLNSADRAVAVHKVLKYFKKHIEPLVVSTKSINKSLNIASEALEFIFIL